jgi:hypothetical protein
VWTALLAKEEGSVSFFVGQTGYTKDRVSSVLKGFAECGVCLEERRRAGNWYRVANREAWKKVLALDFYPPWPNWSRLFEALTSLLRVWVDVAGRSPSEYILGSALRNAFIEAKNDLISSGVPVGSPSPDLFLANEFLPPFRKYLAELLEKALFLPPSS